MKNPIWVKRCKCGKLLSTENKSGMCRCCYIRKWEKENQEKQELLIIRSKV